MMNNVKEMKLDKWNPHGLTPAQTIWPVYVPVAGWRFTALRLELRATAATAKRQSGAAKETPLRRMS